MNWLDDVKWDERGLVPVVAQDVLTGRVLMFAWMDREALARTAETGEAVYYSRSRERLWRKNRFVMSMDGMLKLGSPATPGGRAASSRSSSTGAG